MCACRQKKIILKSWAETPGRWKSINSCESGRENCSRLDFSSSLAACGEDVRKSLKLRGYTFLNSRVRTDKCFRLCVTGETVLLCFSPLRCFHFTRPHLLWAQTKATKNQKNVTIKGADVWIVHRGCWQLSSAVWLQSDALHVFLLLVLPVSLAPSSRLTLCLSACRFHGSSSLTIMFFPLLLGLLVLSLCQVLPLHTQMILYSSAAADSLNSSGRAIRPISPIFRCWERKMRNEIAAMRVAWTDLRCVCVCGLWWMWWLCGLMDGFETCVVRGRKNKITENRYVSVCPTYTNVYGHVGNPSISSVLP